MNSKNEILSKARQYLGTKFLHQGRSKKFGVDCIGLIFCVLQELNIKINGRNLSELDEKNYARIPNGNYLKQKLDENLIADERGFIFLMRFGKNPQHLGFIDFQENGNTKLIHCYQQVGKVIEHQIDKTWAERIINIYRL